MIERIRESLDKSSWAFCAQRNSAGLVPFRFRPGKDLTVQIRAFLKTNRSTKSFADIYYSFNEADHVRRLSNLMAVLVGIFDVTGDIPDSGIRRIIEEIVLI